MKRSSFITWEQLKVGAIVVTALVVIAFAIYKLGKTAHLFHHQYHLTAFLNDANGLMVGGPVMVAGQQAGTISAIDWLPVSADTMRKLRLQFAIDQDLQDQIRRDSKANIKSQGLLGYVVIDIAPGTPGHPVLQPGDTIALVPAPDYQAILAEAAGAVNEMVGVTAQLKVLTSGIVAGRGTLGQLATNPALYNQLVGTLQRANNMLVRFENPRGTFARMLDDPTLYNHLVSTVTSADSLVVAFNDRNGTIGKLLRDDSLYTSLVRMASHGDSLMRSLTDGQGFAGRLLSDPTLYDRLNKLTSDLDAVLADVQQDPRKYTKGAVTVCVPLLKNCPK